MHIVKAYILILLKKDFFHFGHMTFHITPVSGITKVSKTLLFNTLQKLMLTTSLLMGQHSPTSRKNKWKR